MPKIDKWKIKNKKYLSEYGKLYRKNNREKVKLTKRKYHIKSKYNLTIIQYDKMFEKQKGKCFICKKHETELNRPLNIDHCHKTGKVRSLLCHRCNLAVGYYENSDIKKIEKYLNKYRKDVN
jgi:hypothetical protein